MVKMNSPEKSSSALAGSSQELPPPKRLLRRVAPPPATSHSILREEEDEENAEDFFDRSTDMVKRIRKLRQTAEKRMRQMSHPTNYTIEHFCGKAAPSGAKPHSPPASASGVATVADLGREQAGREQAALSAPQVQPAGMEPGAPGSRAAAKQKNGKDQVRPVKTGDESA